MARLVAENGVKRLFKGLLKLVVRHQDQPRMLRLRGKWVEVDPRYWDAELDVQVNVGLGRGSDQDRLQFLMMVAQKQEQIMQLMGPANPLADVSQYRNTLAQICNLAGFKDAGRYFKPVDPQAIQAMAQQPQKPDPNEMLVQVEAAKVKASIERDNQKLQAEVEDSLRQDKREREKMHMDGMLRVAEIEAKYGSQVNVAHAEAVIERDHKIAQAHIDAETNRHNAIVQALSQQEQTRQQVAAQPPQGPPNA